MLISELICRRELMTRTSTSLSASINLLVVTFKTIKILTLLWFSIILTSPVVVFSAKEVPVLEVGGIVGESVRLPCDISVSEEQNTQQEDNVVLILWYREDLGIPIYSIDVRGKDFNQAEKWSDDSVLNKRADFKCDSKWSNLVIDRITEKDEAMYRCRVDFKYAQTRNSKVNLTVIVPPQKVVILDEMNRAKSTVVGPYPEKAVVIFVCQVYGGKPYPSIKWFKDNQLINNTLTNVTIAPDGDSLATSVFTIRNLARTDLHSQLTCEGSNISNKSITAVVEIDMNFSPLDVRIVAEEQPLTAQRKYELVCESTGSRPPAKLTWWKNGDRLERTKDLVSSDGNTTSSILTFIPSKDDKGKYLKCRAENPVIIDGTIRETRWNLRIHYTPETKIILGTSLKPDAIKEGMDVYFDCVINAHPPVYKVEWRKNKKPLQANIQKGVIVSNQSLVLQSVTRASAGNYSCIGYNEEGDGASDPFYLNVMYAPFCKANQTRVYGIAKNEVTNITCEVEANPFDLIFEWRFNNSAAAAAATASVSLDGGEHVPFTLTNSSLGRVMSVVSHMPVQEIDYGTLVCLATNKVGRQRVPCVFHVITAGKPDAVTNCTQYNVSSHSFSIRCVEGFNGGLSQTFHLLLNEDDESNGDGVVEEIYGERHSINMSSTVPSFIATGLKAGTPYAVILYSSNSKGNSESYRLRVVTTGKRIVPVADIHTNRNEDVEGIFNNELATTTEKRRRTAFYAFYTSRWWTMGTIAAATVIILSLLVICIVIIAFKRCQSVKLSADCDKEGRRRHQSQRSRRKMSISNGDLQIFETDKNFSSPVHKNHRQVNAMAVCEPISNFIVEADDKNPDIIPQPVADLNEYLVTKQHISTIENRYLFNENFLKYTTANSPIGYSGYCTLRTGVVPLRDLRRNMNAAATIRPSYEESQHQSLSTSCSNLIRNYQWSPPLVYADSLIDPNYQHIQYQQTPAVQQPLPCSVTHRLTQTQIPTADDIAENLPSQKLSPIVSKQESTV